MPDYLSYRAFARLDNCSEALVRRGVKEGRLPVGPSGGVDAALAGSGWRHGNVAAAHSDANSAHTVAVRALDGEAIEDAAARVTDAARVIPPYADSLARKEFFIANLRQLEYDKESGVVCLVADVAAVVGAELATVRTALLALPSNIAPRLSRLRSVPEIHAAIYEAVVEILTALTADQPRGATS